MSRSIFFLSFFLVTVVVKCTPVINHKVKKIPDQRIVLELLEKWRYNCTKYNAFPVLTQHAFPNHYNAVAINADNIQIHMHKH